MENSKDLKLNIDIITDGNEENNASLSDLYGVHPMGQEGYDKSKENKKVQDTYEDYIRSEVIEDNYDKDDKEMDLIRKNLFNGSQTLTSQAEPLMSGGTIKNEYMIVGSVVLIVMVAVIVVFYKFTKNRRNRKIDNAYNSYTV